ncbi:MAG: hypothetical protein OEU52_05375 [Xanthomonadales bacterium]|nr:hypothetical protein [Xanthomonadales bacterium]
MQLARSEGRIEEASKLTRVVENQFRKLIKFLVGRVSLVKLQEMIRYIFVQEIENKLREDHPEKNIPLTQLALLSGLDTRTLTKIRNNPKYRKPFYEEANFLKELAPGAAILDAWSSNQSYLDKTTGKPMALDIIGKSNSFEALFLETTKSRGVTYKSLLERLIESGAVSFDKKNKKVMLVSNSYLPADSKDKLGAIEMGFSALGNMTDTIMKNIALLDTNEERFFQRGAWTYRLNEQNQNKLRSELNTLLENTDQQAREIIGKYEEETTSGQQITAGVGFFYFEETD